MNNDKIFKVVDNNNKIKKLNIIFTFDDNDSNKSYVVYTDNTYTNNKLNIYASKYDSRLNNPILELIDDENIWKVIETIINNFKINITNS